MMMSAVDTDALVAVERCPGCGFEWSALSAQEVIDRLGAVPAGFDRALAGRRAEAVRARPDPQVWSAGEYVAHVRDVLLNLRDRIVVGLAEDNPTPKPMFADVRIRTGMYALDEVETLPGEVAVAAGLLAKTVGALSEAELARPIFYPWPVPTTRTLLWVAAQALHEAEHHLGDVEAVLASPSASSRR
jgi:hypothetical protein